MLTKIQGIGFIITKRYPAPRGNIADHHLRDPAATIERTISDGGHAVADRHARKAIAIAERLISDAGYAGRKLNRSQLRAKIERMVSNSCNGFRDRHTGQVFAAIPPLPERIISILEPHPPVELAQQSHKMKIWNKKLPRKREFLY